jgi:hypothetical protein
MSVPTANKYRNSMHIELKMLHGNLDNPCNRNWNKAFKY